MFNKRVRALSLVELSISLIIIGIVSSGGMFLLKAIKLRSQIKINQYKHQLIIKAVARFAKQQGYLPKPSDSIEEGISRAIESVKVYEIGCVPWKTLNIPKGTAVDSKGKPIAYVTDARFTNKKLTTTTCEMLELTDIDEPTICYLPGFVPGEEQLTVHRSNGLLHTTGQSFDVYQIIGQFYQSTQTEVIDRVAAGLSIENKEQTASLSANTAASVLRTGSLSYNAVQGRPKLQKLDQVYDCLVLVLVNGGQVDSGSIDASIYDFVSYVTRFNLELYGGPTCRPFIRNKTKLVPDSREQISIVDSRGVNHIATSFIDIVES